MSRNEGGEGREVEILSLYRVILGRVSCKTRGRGVVVVRMTGETSYMMDEEGEGGGRLDWIPLCLKMLSETE